MLQKRRSLGGRKVSPPQPTCMTDDQKASYLMNLRSNRPARPGGARPLPGRPTIPGIGAGAGDKIGVLRSESSMSSRKEQVNRDEEPNPQSIPNSSSMPLIDNFKGRALVQAPLTNTFLRGGNIIPRTVQDPAETGVNELTSREIEKREAHSIRETLEEIDHADDESRIYTAAQQEAADLVWKHLNPTQAEEEKTAAYKNPDLQKSRNHDAVRTVVKQPSHSRTDSERSIAERMAQFEDLKVEGLRLTKRGSRDDTKPQKVTPMHSARRRSSGKRNISGGSSKSVFRNPEDEIYEEPSEIDTPAASQETAQELPLQTRPRNVLPRGSRPLPGKPFTVPLPDRSRRDTVEIYRNPPTQSRRADYTANPPSREATPEVETPKGRAMEIRSDEIRAATSMRRKDRSPKLPTPTAVSDRPGRPIVSFDPTWRPGNESPKTSMDLDRPLSRPTPPPTVTCHSAPAVPTINLPDDEIPSIQVTTEEDLMPSVSVTVPVPSITFSVEPDRSLPVVPSINLPSEAPTRPLPQINVNGDPRSKIRPLPTHSHSSPSRLPRTGGPVTNRVPWLSRGPAASSAATVTCNSCQLSISGRIVTASGSKSDGPKARFHPECFTCFHCSTKLECVSFYPEPETARVDRLEQNSDHDPSEMRFYCHLDYHDFFSPRCASCKTPIEGAVILAAGKSWHEGHFFCAECGDPFSSTSPFVEDKGYAYCVCCHTKRTSARCRACKKQILDETSVEALGGKWHEQCFRCDECQGDFGEEGRFFVREIEIELTEKEKRKGMTGKKFEERAVCQRCEELRLRRVDAFL